MYHYVKFLQRKSLLSGSYFWFGRNNNLLSKNLCSIPSFYTVKDTRFNGVYVNISSKSQSIEDFESTLKDFLDSWEQNAKRSAFIEVPIAQSHFIPVAAKYGFQFHHARYDKAVLYRWMEKGTPDKIPSYANHTVGVAGACYDEVHNNLLMVKDKGRYMKWWKFPGGFSNLKEFIGETAVREVYEETGIKSEFKSMLSFRQQHDTSFGQSDLYYICRLKPTTFEICACPDEIAECEWKNVEELLKMDNVTPFVKLICRLLLKGKENGFETVDIVGEEMESWVTKNKKMILYHRTIEWTY